MAKQKQTFDEDLSPEALSEMYAQIADKSSKEIANLIDGNDSDSYRMIAGLGGGLLAGCTIGNILENESEGFGWIIGGSQRKRKPSSVLIEICKDYASTYKSEIKTILKKNPQTTRYILNIIQLLVPAIAQQYSGIPALAIVGSVILLCRQGIENFIR